MCLMRTGESALKLRGAEGVDVSPSIAPRGNIASKTRFIVFLARKDCNAMSPRLVHFSHTLLDYLNQAVEATTSSPS